MAEGRLMREDKQSDVASAVRKTGKSSMSRSGQLRGGEFAGQARRMTENTAGQALSVLSDRKAMAADSLSSIAMAVHETGRNLRRQDQDMVAEFADRAAGQVDHFARFLRDRDIDDLADEVQQFARRQPAVLVGGAFLLGLVGARFLKSSSQPQRRSKRRETRKAAAKGKPASIGELRPKARSTSHRASEKPKATKASQPEQIAKTAEQSLKTAGQSDVPRMTGGS